MNIHKHKNSLKKARSMIIKTQNELIDKLRKRKRDYNKIKTLKKRVEDIEGGMQNLNEKIRNLRQSRKRVKAKGLK